MSDEKDSLRRVPKGRKIGQWLAIGVALGAVIGAALDNLELGVAPGLVFGLAIGASKDRKTNQKK